MIRVLIADDHEIVAEGLRRLLGDQPDMVVVGCVDNGRDAVRVAVKSAEIPFERILETAQSPWPDATVK